MSKILIALLAFLTFVGCSKKETVTFGNKSNNPEFDRNRNEPRKTINDRLEESIKEENGPTIDAMQVNESKLREFGAKFPAVNSFSESQEIQDQKVKLLKALSHYPKDPVLELQARNLLEGMRSPSMVLQYIVAFYYRDQKLDETELFELNKQISNYPIAHYKLAKDITLPDVSKHIDYYYKNKKSFDKDISNLEALQSHLFSYKIPHGGIINGEIVCEFSNKKQLEKFESFAGFIYENYGYNQDRTKFGPKESL